MRRSLFVMVAPALLALCTVTGWAQGVAQFAGMTCGPLTDAQLTQIEEAYGEQAGVGITAVEDGSLAAKTGVKAGDILLSVRLPEETDFYPIPPDIDEMIAFAKDTEPSEQMRLLIYRPEDGELKRIECLLGTPIGQEPAPAADDDAEAADCVVNSESFSFASEDPQAVLAKTADGSPLIQADVDIYGGLLAWAFGTRLNEGQKTVVRDALVEFWPQATAEVVGMFDQGVRSMPDMVPKLGEQEREQLRQNFAGVFVQTAQGMPGHPLAQVILAVSGSARNVLAGAGTPNELTQQDVDALLEYLSFQAQVQGGQPILITPEQHAAFTQQTVAHFNAAPDEEKQTLAQMDVTWGRMRAYWAAAEAAQQQALAQQWQQAYAQQQAAMAAGGGGYAPGIGGWQGAYGGGDMSQGSYDAVLNSMNTLHDSSMSTLGSIDGGYDTSAYDSAGNWLYDY